MLYVILGIGILIFAIGFILNENNAKYLLSGYNTMSEEQRESFDLAGFIPFFRNFHIFLGLSLILIGAGTELFIGGVVPGLFLGIYPIVAYIYFIWKAQHFYKGTATKTYKLGMWVLVATLIFVIGLTFWGMRENTIALTQDYIEIGGSYGENLSPEDLQSVRLTKELPKIKVKVNGFSLGDFKRGYFRTRDGEKVKFLLNSTESPFIVFHKKSGEKVYFKPKTESSEVILKVIQEQFPTLEE